MDRFKLSHEFTQQPQAICGAGYLNLNGAMQTRFAEEHTTSAPDSSTPLFHKFPSSHSGIHFNNIIDEKLYSYIPLVLWMGGDDEHLPLMENKLRPGHTIIYVCRNKVCKLPVEDAVAALKQIRE